jgi:hypothetical protein
MIDDMNTLEWIEEHNPEVRHCQEQYVWVDSDDGFWLRLVTDDGERIPETPGASVRYGWLIV